MQEVYGMRFPNACKGIPKLLAAQILGIAAIVAAIAAGGAAVAFIASGNLGGTGTAALIALLAGSVIGIVGMILTIVGFAQARKDEANFSAALIMTLVALAAQIASTFVITANPTVGRWLDFAGSIFQLAAFQYAVMGIISLAAQMGDRQVEASGRRLRVLVTVLWLVVVVLEFFGNVLGTAAGYVGIGGAVLELVVTIMYIVLLAKARKMLAN